MEENNLSGKSDTQFQAGASEYDDRKNKLSLLKQDGVLAYAERFVRSNMVNEVLAKNGEHRSLEEMAGNVRSDYKVAGRVMLMRPHGKLTFAHLKDQSGKMQVCFTQNELGEKYKMLKRVDVGDFLGVEGELFITKHGELTLLVKDYVLLSKTLRPLPEKWHGINDQETKYRYRYLEMIADQSSFDRFVFRSRLISNLRAYLDENLFLEIETPILCNTASGAAAKPFATHHNALDIDVYLRIAPETYLKRAVVGGLERVYEFAKCFRNEGIDPSHLQEFMMLEYYAAYWNYEDNMDFTESMLKKVLEKMLGGLKVTVADRDGNPVEIDFGGKWPRYEFVELIKENSGINILDFYQDTAGLLAEIKKKGVVIEKAETLGYGNLCDALYKKVARPKLINPCFVIKHPVDTKPLARKNDADERLADSFQLLVNTWEIVNAYSELIDPVDQAERLMRQADAKEAGDEEAMPMDEDFIFAMEHGMPPMSGFGMGIDRLVALITSQDNLKDTVMFPIMKPLNKNQ